MKLVKDLRNGSTTWVTEHEAQAHHWYESIVDAVDAVIATAEGFMDKHESSMYALEDVIESVTGIDIDINGNDTEKTSKKEEQKKKQPKKKKTLGNGSLVIEQTAE